MGQKEKIEKNFNGVTTNCQSAKHKYSLKKTNNNDNLKNNINDDLKESQKDNIKSDSKRWIIKVCFLSFLLSIVFSYISTTALNNITIVPAIIILLFVISIGTITDTIAMAVTVADENEFHAMATKKVPGAKKAIKLIRKASQVSSFCADVIGDICGVLSGTISAILALKIVQSLNLNFNIEFLITAIVASVTITSKAIDKGIAKKYSTQIVGFIAKVLEGKRYSSKEK